MSTFKKLMASAIVGVGLNTTANAADLGAGDLTNNSEDSKICQSIVKDYNVLANASNALDQISRGSFSYTSLKYETVSGMANEIDKRKDGLKLAAGLACSGDIEETIKKLSYNNFQVNAHSDGLPICDKMVNDYNVLSKGLKALGDVGIGSASFSGVPYSVTADVNDAIRIRQDGIKVAHEINCPNNRP